MKNILERKPIFYYYLATFLVSWAGIISVSFFLGMPTTSSIFETYGPLALIPFLLGPSMVGFFFTAKLFGRAGIKELFQRLFRWNFKKRWYLFSVFTIPLFIAVWLMILNYFSEAYTPRIFYQSNKMVFILTGILTGLIGGGLLEELGWTGFITPLFLKSNSIMKTGLLMGFFWGLWHFLPVYWGSGDEQGIISWSQFLPGLFSHYAVLIPFRIIQVWLYAQTKSLLPNIIFHSTLTTFALFLFSIENAGFPVFIYYLGIAFFLWGLVILLPNKNMSMNRDH